MRGCGILPRPLFIQSSPVANSDELEKKLKYLPDIIQAKAGIRQ
jgi:hypothetical protein